MRMKQSRMEMNTMAVARARESVEEVGPRTSWELLAVEVAALGRRKKIGQIQR